MANISQELSKIQSAVYGEEIRGSIHDAIQAMNEQANESDTKATNAQNLAVEAREAAFVAQDSAAAKAAEAAQSALEAANTVNGFDQHASQVTANLDDHASQVTANLDDHASQVTANLDDHVTEVTSNLDDHASQVTEEISQLTANLDDHASQVTEKIDEAKNTAVSSAAAAKRSEDLAREFAGDVVDKVVDLESLDPVDAVGNASLFVVSSGGENKSATGKQVLDYIFSNNEDREIDISDPDRIVQTSDSEQVITTISKDENNNDVIITKRIPNDGIFVYVTETVIANNVISVTNRTEEKEVNG